MQHVGDVGVVERWQDDHTVMVKFGNETIRLHPGCLVDGSSTRRLQASNSTQASQARSSASRGSSSPGQGSTSSSDLRNDLRPSVKSLGSYPGLAGSEHMKEIGQAILEHNSRKVRTLLERYPNLVSLDGCFSLFVMEI